MKTKSYIFWIRSGRGTDSQQITTLNSDLNKSGIKDELERWCAGFGAWDHDDNYVHYGWADASKTNLNKLRKYNEQKQEYRIICDKAREHSITLKEFDAWRKKHNKQNKFPFK
jgi:hypothetical protein